MNRLASVRRFWLAVGMLVGGAAIAADGIESRTLQFAKGASSASVKGTIAGRQTIDYRLRAKAGQTMTVKLVSSHAGLAFNVLPPGSQDVAIPEAIERQSWTGVLPAEGEYTIRTYLVRSAARRGEKASYTLTVSIDGAATASGVAASSGRPLDATGRAGEGRFDATGKIPCAQAKGQPMTQCDFGVARAGGGTATVAVTRPDGRKRFIFFEKGKATGADLSQADGDLTFRATKEVDLFKIQAGSERYEIPEAVVFVG
jgi:hypothetical protein